jgi:hypothetical protein
VASNLNRSRKENISARLFFWLGLVAVAAAFAAGAWLTWRRWPDLIIDFGPQLYMPWRISEGARLYRDIFYLSGGPLSQYFNAALFQSFGVSFLTLVIANLTLAALMLLVIYRQFTKASNAFAGSCITVAVVIAFAFAQYTGIGNCNYATPYSHEILHSLVLAVFAVGLLARWLDSQDIQAALLAGFCTGLVGLGKPDIAVAVLLTTAAALVMTVKLNWPRKFIVKSVTGFILAAAVPLAGFFLMFLRTESWRESLRLEFYGWLPLASGSVVNNPYYQWSLGFDAPFDHLRQSSIHFLTTAAIVTVCALMFRAAGKLPPAARWPLNVTVIGALVLAAQRFYWPGCGASLPLLCVTSIGLLLHRFRNEARGHDVIFPLLWSVFALLMLAKQGVFPRIWHTGFALAMPAFACAIFLFLRLLPDFLKHRFQIPSLPMRLAAAGVLVMACISLGRVSTQYYSAKNLAVGHRGDLILARGPDGNAVEARTLNLALDWIEKNVPEQSTLAAIPQGAMLNYLSRRANPTPCLDWNPTLLAFFGAANMTAALTNHPPDYIALVEWQTYEFGTGYFGTAGYGDDVMAWIRENYRPAALFGSEPLRNGLFGIQMLKRVPDALATNNVTQTTLKTQPAKPTLPPL